jgi:hypothetical protein
MKYYMTTNYKYKSKDTMKALSSTTATTGINTPTYTAFENVPITIAASRALSTSTSLVSTSITSQTTSGFNSVSYYKVATANTSAGGTFASSEVNYFSIDNTAIQGYKNNGFPIIQAGGFTIPSTSDYTVSFNTTFQNNPIVVVCPTGDTTHHIITATVKSTTTTSFVVTSYYKDGRSGRAGGGRYCKGSLPGTFNYIAVDPVAVSKYKSSSGPTVKAGTVTPDVTISGLGFASGKTVYVFCSPIGDTSHYMISCNVTSVSPDSFSIKGLAKDGRNNEDGGAGWTNTFNYIAIAV